MAQKVEITLVDDLDGGVAVETVDFGLDGITYAIDLSEKNAAKLRKVLGEYVGSARRTGKANNRSRSSNGSKATGPRPSDVREWARGHGFEVPDRGRIPEDVRAAYDAAH